MKEKKYLNFGQKLAYGSGDFASNFAFTFVSSFVLIYLTDTVGLNSGIVGVLIMVSKLLDGITDVIFGSLVDRTKSKMGKARPWMFWSTFPLGITVMMQFMVPDTSTGLQYAYFFVVYTLMNAIFYTANNISYSTMSALITKNNTERVQLGVFRYIFALIAALAISSVTSGLVISFGGGATGWRNVAVIYGAILIVVNTISVLCVKEIPDEISNGVDDKQQEPQKVGFVKSIGHLLHNKFYFMILGIYIINSLNAGISTGVGIYYMTYVLGDASMLGLFSMAAMFPMMLGLMATPFFVKRWGMYKTNLISMLLAVVVSIPYIIAGMNTAVYIMLALAAVRGILTGPMTGSLQALTAETSRYSKLKDGVQIDGMIFSCTSLGTKLGSGIGSALGGWLLAIGGYNGLAEVQTAGALSMISFMYIIIPSIAYAIMFVFISKLNVEKVNAELDTKATNAL